MRDVKINIAKDVNLSAQTIMTNRGCILGQSGSGKSYLAGIILEELCRLKLPFCVVDTEGEYYPLRTAFQVIIVGGDKGDVGLEVDFYMLFKRSIQNNLPIILDLSETLQKTEILNKALSELYKLEEELSCPYLLLVEEADKFAPQTHHVPGMLEELAVRGRKRGIGLLIISQRPANIDKNILAQCAYGFIGKLAIENDINAISLFFSRSTLRSIAAYKSGEFSSFGLGFDGTIHVKRMITVHGGATPTLKKPLPGEKLSKVLQELKQKIIVATVKNNNEKQVTVNTYALLKGIDEDHIRDYAGKKEKKEFILFGKRIESIDAITEKFISVVLIGLRLPLRHDGEYKEAYVMLDDKIHFIVLNDELSISQGPIMGESRLLKEDYDVLSELAKKRKESISSIDKELGMGIRATHNSINRLKSRKLVYFDGKNVSLINYERFLMQNKPALVQLNVPVSLIINRRIDERIEKDWAKTIFPSSILFECERVLIPIYEIKLRQGNKIRILLIEAVHGGEIK
jgi:hypothetical protein